MQRIPMDDLERRCQKPDHRQIGNWMARRISRPAALRITRMVAPWGISANVATLAAWGCGVGAAAAFGWGSVAGWLVGAGLLQLWYLLDHVDGQLARLRGTASLDGVQLDYLMHHTVNLIVPLGIGFGLFARSAEPLWLLGALAWGVSLLLITLQHDARYKAFVRRLKRVRGQLQVFGGGGGRPTPQPPAPRSPLRLAGWAARKACEAHVVMNVLLTLAVVQWVLGDTELIAGRIYVAASTFVAVVTAAGTIVRSQQAQSAEQEFAAWYRVPPGCELAFSDGWWVVRPAEGASRIEDRQDGRLGNDPSARPQESS
jgi:phosphatidylglycerophosphate synthase